MPISKGSNFNAANPQTVIARLVDFGKGSPPVAGGSTARDPRPMLGANRDHAPAAVLYAAKDRLTSQGVTPRSAILQSPNESTSNGAFPLRGKVPEGRMRGRVANGEDVRMSSPGRQLDVPPPPAPPPRRCRLCWAERVSRERGDALSMAKPFACHRRDDNLMFPHPRPLPRDGVGCVGRSGFRGSGGT